MDSEAVETGVSVEDAPAGVPEVNGDLGRGEPDGLSEPDRAGESSVPDGVMTGSSPPRSPAIEDVPDPKEAREMILTELKTGQPRASLKKYQKPSNTFVVGP
ncbi:PREDICTED: uncharacterized protein LOC109461828 [Branchiostoma belcheri]|uniref:Uncharacterized protein LOC109461828 n=1 Tax=Branchiostoma belcheri TaxID=7741 RepID=A0A6P4XBM9_BRABE|nr:PREDICTED: uncharacterized protein LOC109461828 [Branchiostoma belcheri]